MAKRIEIEGKFYRMRRGELVQIPDEWIGETVYSSQKRHRLSHLKRKLAKSTNGYTIMKYPSREVKQHKKNSAPRHMRANQLKPFTDQRMIDEQLD